MKKQILITIGLGCLIFAYINVNLFKSSHDPIGICTYAENVQKKHIGKVCVNERHNKQLIISNKAIFFRELEIIATEDDIKYERIVENGIDKATLYNPNSEKIIQKINNIFSYPDISDEVTKKDKKLFQDLEAKIYNTSFHSVKAYLMKAKFFAINDNIRFTIYKYNNDFIKKIFSTKYAKIVTYIHGGKNKKVIINNNNECVVEICDKSQSQFYVTSDLNWALSDNFIKTDYFPVPYDKIFIRADKDIKNPIRKIKQAVQLERYHNDIISSFLHTNNVECVKHILSCIE